MTRLNKNIREKILSNALEKAGVITREEKLIDRRAALAETCRLHGLGGVEKEDKIKKIAEYRKKLLTDLNLEYGVYGSFSSSIYEKTCVEVAFGGMQVNLYFNGAHNKYANEDVYKSPVPCRRVLFTADHELSLEFNEIEKESNIVKSLRENVTANVRAITSSVNTVKRLIDIWPESKELIPTDAESAKINLPSVNVGQLNTIIGIPTE